MKNEFLKKHHFWVLLGVVPLIVLIAVVMITSGVGSDIEAAESKTKKAISELTAKQNPKPDALIGRLEKQVDQVKGREGDLWKANWERQKDLFVWPNSPLLKQVEKMGLKFGAPIPDKGGFEDVPLEFRKPEVYLAEYSVAAVKNAARLAPGAVGMVDAVAPTQFKDGWRGVLRHVSQFPEEAELTSEQIWLLLEDLWVQRSLLDAVRAVNAQMARFDRVKYVSPKDGQVIDDPDPKGLVKDPLRRKFRSRIWEVELEVVEKDGRKSLAGRLTNHTDRLQLMGLGSTMVLKVWLEPDVDRDGRPRPGVRPFEFRIGGEFLPGKGAVKADGKTPANVLDVIPTDDHLIPATENVAEIYKVEQVFDARTVPVRRIDAVRLGKTDSRYAALQNQLVMPSFPAYEKEAAAAAAAATALPGLDGQTPSGVPPRTDPGRTDDPTGKGVEAAGGGSVEAVLNANKRRYVQVTKSVRRMPVGVVLVVDQAYQQDVLMAFANSPLRFQTTQAPWVRFRDRLGGVGRDGSTGPGAGADPGADVRVSGPGVIGDGLRPGTFGLEGGPFRGPPPGVTPPGVSPTPGALDPGSATVSESQLTSGLIELSVYGVVSLYEKPDAPAPPADAPKDPKDPKDATVTGPKAAKPRRRSR